MEKAAPGSPEWRQAWQQLFLLELDTDKTFKAAADLIADLKKADPNAEELLYAEAVLAMYRKEYPQAAELLRNLTQSKEGRSLSQAYYLLGRVLILQGNDKEAVSELSLRSGTAAAAVAGPAAPGPHLPDAGKPAGRVARSERDPEIRPAPGPGAGPAGDCGRRTRSLARRRGVARRDQKTGSRQRRQPPRPLGPLRPVAPG